MDNVLWMGQVLDEKNQSESTVAIRALNKKIHKDPRVAISTLAISDGLTLCRKL